jgi:hypothetical protein
LTVPSVGPIFSVVAMTHEKRAAWAAEVEAQIGRYAILRKQVRYFPLIAVLTAPLGFIWAPWVAISIFLGWLSLWGTTLYITHMKAWQYRQELLQLRADDAALNRQ